MAYEITNPPRLVAQPIAGLRHWQYASTDPNTTVDNDGYFSNGWDLGMRAGDTVDVIDTDASPIAVHRHVVNSATKEAGVDLTAGVAVSGADSD